MWQPVNRDNRALLEGYYTALADVMTAATDEELVRAQKRIESMAPGVKDRLKALPQEHREIILAGDTVERCTADLMNMTNSDGYKDGPEEMQDTFGGKLGLSGVVEELAKKCRNRLKRNG